MKKAILIIAASLCFGVAAQAGSGVDFGMSNSVFTKGDIVATAGANLSGYFKTHFTVGGGAEYCILDGLIGGKNGSVGAGASLAYASIFQGSDVSTSDHGHFDLVLRGAFHYQFLPKLDTYAALELGLMLNNEHVTYIASGLQETLSYTYSVYGLRLGGRYYFHKDWAGCFELGFSGYSQLSLGVCKKF